MNKLALAPIITAVIVIVVLILGGMAVYTIGREKIEISALTLSKEAEKEINVTLKEKNITALTTSQPWDECDNNKGESIQDTSKKKEVNYENCTSLDCCCCYVYSHVLDLNIPVEDVFVDINFTITNPTKVLFYYSETGEKWDWHKFYHTSYTSPGEYQIILPIAGRFRYIKLITPDAYIQDEYVQAGPYLYKGELFADVCKETPSTLEPGRGYIVKMTEGGNWSYP